MFFNIGTPELLVIFIVALIVVGPRRLPEIGRQIGRAINELRKVQDEVRDMVKFDLSGDTAQVPETKPVPTPHHERGAPLPEGQAPVPGPEPGPDDQSLETTELPTRQDLEAGPNETTAAE